jgi:hypothetical protein
MQLRQLVAVYLDAIQQQPVPLNPQTNRPLGLDPIDTAAALMEAVGQISMLNVRISAFDDLLKQERFADFMDVLLPPPVPQAYRDDAMNYLMYALKGGDLSEVPRPTVGPNSNGAGVEEQGGEGDDEDDEDEDDDDNESNVVSLPARAN